MSKLKKIDMSKAHEVVGVSMPPLLKAATHALCLIEDKSASELIREMIIARCVEHGIHLNEELLVPNKRGRKKVVK